MARESKNTSIELVYALPKEQQLLAMNVPQGTTARQAVIRAIDEGRIALVGNEVEGAAKLPIGVYGELVDDSYVLLEGDRVEIYRPLIQDPKERRRRIAQQSGID